jgi:hypothetical protein
MRIPVQIKIYEVTKESSLNPKFRKSVDINIEVIEVPATASDLGSAVYSNIQSKNLVKGMDKKKEEIEVNGFIKTGSETLPSSVIRVKYSVYVAPTIG